MTSRILLVDDDLRMRTLLEEYLTQQGFFVLTLADGRQLDATLAEERIDLVVLDVMLPGKDGLAICAGLRANGCGVPIIMLTAKGDRADRIVGLDLGADDYMPKPFEPRELVSRIRAVLRRHRGVVASVGSAQEPAIYRFGPFELDTNRRVFAKAGTPLELTSGELATAGLYFKPLRMEYVQLLASRVKMARAALVAGRPLDGVGIEIRKSAEGVQLSAPRALASWETEVRTLAGSDVELHSNAPQSRLWVRFLAAGNPYWLVIPIVPIPGMFSTALLLTAAIAVLAALAGAYLLITRLNQHLKAVVHAARTLGRGEIPARLAVEGPQEIRELSHGFNQMSDGLQRLERDRRVMLAGISHDLRTPLARLRLGVELGAPVLKPTHAEGMVRDIAEMDAILEEFLSFARSDVEEAAQPCDVNALVSEVCARYRLARYEVGTSLRACGPARLRRLAVRRLIANLVDNAVRYGKRDVAVTTTGDAERTVLTVADRGPGIHSAPGLGLTVVDRIARSHAGGVELQNREDGGVVVTVVLLTAH